MWCWDFSILPTCWMVTCRSACRPPRMQSVAMVPFGGNVAVHGATLAAHAGISDIIIPPASGVFSALGLLFARIQHRLVSVYWRDVDAIEYPLLNKQVQDLY